MTVSEIFKYPQDYLEFTKYDMAGTASNTSFQLPSTAADAVTMYVGLRAGDLANNFARYVLHVYARSPFKWTNF